MIDKYIRGATYQLDIKLTENGVVIDNGLIDTIEFTFGDISKYYPTDSEYDEMKQCYKVYLTQEDTLALNSVVKSQVRVKFKTGDVSSSNIKNDTLYPTLSEKIL